MVYRVHVHVLTHAAGGSSRECAVDAVDAGVTSAQRTPFRHESTTIDSSNVNAIHELTEIMSLARQFEIEVKLLKNAEENDSAAAQLLRIG